MRVASIFGKIISTLVLHMSLLLFVISLTIVFFLIQKNTIKDTLSDSGIYDDFAATSIEAIEEESKNSNSEEFTIPISDPAAKEIIISSINPQELKTEVEGAIDGIYSWIEGDSEQIVFILDLSKSANRVISNLKTYTIERVEMLRDCTVQDLSIQELDVFKLECKPPGNFINQINEQVDSLLEDDSFLDGLVISSDTIKDDSSGTLEEEYEALKDIYSNRNNLVLVTVVILLLAAALFIIIFHPFTHGLEILGRNLIVSSTIGFIIVLIARLASPGLMKNAIDDGRPTSELGISVANTLISKTTIFMSITLLAIALLGAVLIGMMRVNHTKQGNKK